MKYGKENRRVETSTETCKIFSRSNSNNVKKHSTICRYLSSNTIKLTLAQPVRLKKSKNNFSEDKVYRITNQIDDNFEFIRNIALQISEKTNSN